MDLERDGIVRAWYWSKKGVALYMSVGWDGLCIRRETCVSCVRQDNGEA